MVPDEPGDLPNPEARREDLYRQLGQVADFRRGCTAPGLSASPATCGLAG